MDRLLYLKISDSTSKKRVKVLMLQVPKLRLTRKLSNNSGLN